MIPKQDSWLKERGAGTSIVSCDAGLGIASVGPVCLVVWRGTVTTARFLQQKAALEQTVVRFPGQAGFVCVIQPEAPPPAEDLRKASADMIRAQDGRLRAVACVIESSGFGASVTRSVLAGMSLLAPIRSTSIKITHAVDIAATWLARQCDVSSEQLLLADSMLRRRLDANKAAKSG